jgi:hypothetical protein
MAIGKQPRQRVDKTRSPLPEAGFVFERRVPDKVLQRIRN